ncbi:MAG: ferrous iron transport protein A [Candidatus Cloacimonetes bacterium]|jgi:ferrous iron transport protein A|nr:ferrous iron transport protein A [Candidatus Cloacimonadota bacterium]MBT4331676.1 ferrous iron transport protein A [Candidatus Cloacimonadota bacterium]MBT5420413.1 ferrous iron transport protein A [Candidatus Cloacimonadota bacterium]
MKNKLFSKIHNHHGFKHSNDNNDLKTIHNVKDGEVAKIKDVIGGKHFISKAESLGIRIGVQITKISSQMMHGPITIKVGQSQIAIGHRMANKIIIE